MPPPTTRSTGKLPKKVNCNCAHEYQDEKYGKGVRIANHARGKNEYRCTVCGKTHP